MKRTKRWLCLLLVFCMMLSVLPVTASAENAAESTAEHHLLLADDFKPSGWTIESTKKDQGALSTNTLRGGKTGTSSTVAPATATVKIETAGEYHVWVHALYHQAAEIQSTSWKTKVKVNEMVLDTVFGGHHNAADAYVWVEGGTVSLTAGNATIALDDSEYNDWARVDGVWLSSSNYNPTGKTLAELQAAAVAGSTGSEEQPETPTFNKANAVIADNISTAVPQSWTASTWRVEFYGDDYLTSKTDNAQYQWTLNLPKAGDYALWVHIPSGYKHSASQTETDVKYGDVCTNAQYTVQQEQNTFNAFTLNQEQRAGWYKVSATELVLQAGAATITLNAGTLSGEKQKSVFADAVALLPRDAQGGESGETPRVLIVDNTDANTEIKGTFPSDTGKGWMGESIYRKGFAGSNYYTLKSGDENASFTWKFVIPEDGYYALSVNLPDCKTGMETSGGTYEITAFDLESNAAKTYKKQISHQHPAGYVSLGEYYFKAGTDAQKVLTLRSTNVNDVAVVDAAKLEYVAPAVEPMTVDNTDTNNVDRTGTFPDTFDDDPEKKGWAGANTAREGYIGENYYTLKGGDKDASFTWKFQIPKDGIYELEISLPNCEEKMELSGGTYEISTYNFADDKAETVEKKVSHKSSKGWVSLGQYSFKAAENLQDVLTLRSMNVPYVAVVDAAMLTFVKKPEAVESGSYTIDLNDPQQTILGLGVEIQSESLGSGNTMDETDLEHSVPHDLTKEERQRLYTDMLSGFRYMRLAGGLFYRGTDAEQKHLVEHWDTQDDELAELLRVSGIEGFNFEFWSPTPYFKSNGAYHGGKLKCFDENWEYSEKNTNKETYETKKREFLEDFADTIIADFQRMRAAGLPVVQFSLQNEPALKSVYGTYSFCYYSAQDYYETCKVVLPKLKAAFPDLFIHANSWKGQHDPSSGKIRTDADTLACVDAWSWHTVGYNADYMLTNRNWLNQGTDEKPVINTEFEYQPTHFKGKYEFRFVNTAQAIMNWMVFENSPTWFWLHCLKPLGNEESLGYGLGYWRKSGDTATYEVGNEVEEQHWDYNYPNYNALRGFLKYMPWDSVRYGVKEDKIRTDQRIMAWKSPEGQLAFAVTNRSTDKFRFNVDTTLADVTFVGYRLTSNSKDFISLGEKTGAQISTTLEPYTIEFWVQREDPETMEKAESVTLNKPTLTLAVNGTEQLTATVNPDDAANKDVRWTSSDSTVVKVDETGNLTALKEGTATITATAISGSGRIKDSCEVTVTSEISEVNKTALKAAIDEAETKKKDDYTEDSWNNFKAALDVAKEVFDNDDATQEEVNAAAAKLNKAIADLQKKPTIDSGDAIGALLPLLPALGSDTQVTFPFNDVSKADWYYNSVRSAWYNGLIDGVSRYEFQPDSTLTVAQAIKLAAALYQMEHEGKVRLANGETKWYDTYVSYAIANGIIESSYASYTDAQMNAPVTRGEFVHIFHGAKNGYTAISTVADGAIPDVKTTDKYAAEVYELYRAGILTGSDAKGTFHAASTIKRSEAATILLRMFDSSARVPITLG